MRHATFWIGLGAVLLFIAGHDAQAQRGGRGGGGGFRGGGGSVGPYGGGGVSTRSTGTVVGPAGGSRTVGSGSGSYTTNRGTTINYAAAGRGVTTPGGVSAGRGVGGVQVTTPGGQTATRVGTVRGVTGPGGNTVAGRSGVTSTTGPRGSATSAYRGGVAVGPQGAVAGGTRVGTVSGPGGTASSVARGGVAVGPYGAAVGGARVTTGNGTYYRSAAVVTGQATTVRQNFRSFARDYPVLTARWLGPTWRPITWAALASYASYPVEPVYYDYGETIVYEGDTVYLNGEVAGTTEQYAQQAIDIAATGKAAKVEPKGEEWQSLGVFAMVQEGEAKATNIFQLSVNKEGVIRGEYYNALLDTTEPVYGSVDQKTQRAAWTVAERKTPVYEAGIANLTKNETTMMVHYSKEKSQQYLLIRIEQPMSEQSPEQK